MKAVQIELVPNVMFNNRKLFIEKMGILDKDAAKVAYALGEILNDVLPKVLGGPKMAKEIIIGKR
jgi:hypothetical protein